MIDIERLLKDLKMNQADLASFLNKAPSAITKVKKGEMSFPDEWKRAILKKFKIDVNEYKLENPIIQDNIVNKNSLPYNIDLANEAKPSYFNTLRQVHFDNFMETAYLPVGTTG